MTLTSTPGFYWQNRAYPGCTRLAEILDGLSHDSVNRFLLRERYEPKDLFNELKPHINLICKTLSGDDTVIKKPYSDIKACTSALPQVDGNARSEGCDCNLM